MHPWRERLHRWFLPLAKRCPISPNAITIIAFLLNLIAAFCLWAGKLRPALFLVAIAFLIVGGLADAFDGIVARAQDKCTRFGDLLDHVADRVSDAAVAAAWMIGSGVRQELTAFALLLVMLNGYVGTQVEATYGERNYDSVGRGEFVLALIVFPIVSFIVGSNGWAAARLGTLTTAEWLTVVLIAFAVLGVVQRLILATKLERSR